MHYKNGREAKAGDKIVLFNNGKPEAVGYLVEPNAGSQTCNGRLIRTPIDNAPYVTVSDCLHSEDVAAAVTKPAV